MNKIVVWGFSPNSIMKTLSYINMYNAEIVCFVDKDSTKQEWRIGKDENLVIAPNDITNYQFDYIILASSFAKPIMKQIEELGIDKHKVLHLPYRPETIDDVLSDYENMENRIETYKSVFRWRLDYKESVDKIDEFVKKARVIHKYLKGNVFEFYNVKISYEAYKLSPKLFIEEAFDILRGTISEIKEYFSAGEGEYEFAGVKLEEGDIVFDFGANVGEFSALAATKIQNGKVYAFEPIPQIQSVLKNSCDLYENIEIVSYAISDCCEKVDMDIEGVLTGWNIGAAHISKTEGKTSISVNAITLDEFVEKNNIQKVDFIKADIEGAEPAMLYGAKHVLQKWAPKLSICTYHNANHPEYLQKIIKEINPNYIIEHQWLKLYAYVPK